MPDKPGAPRILVNGVRMILCVGILLFPARILAAPEREPAQIRSKFIDRFKFGSDERRFGRLEFLGGIEMVSTNRMFGAFSSIRLRPDHKSFVGVLDTGHWITGEIDRDAKGQLSGLSEVFITPMQNRAGRVFSAKGPMDAEGLAFNGSRILVSFEGRHRIEAYLDPGFETSKAIATLPFPIPLREMEDNKGLETIAVAPRTGPLRGAAVVICEESFDSEGRLCGAILDGPSKGRFSVLRSGDFDPTDAAFLPNGDLLILERRFTATAGPGMRLRLVPAADLHPGAAIEGDILMTADFSYQIDNMEGLDLFKAADGTPHLILVSDDNHSILQRNLMLEFRLLD